jgi:N-glycosylase/DNA lyase
MPNDLQITYEKYEPLIKQRLADFANIKPEFIFYEFCFCIMTPQSSAANAWQVQDILIEKNFLHHPFDATDILGNRTHYIRFHNQKAKRLLNAIDFYPQLTNVLDSNMDRYDKRQWIKDNFIGVGMKEASHFLRNIGYKGLAIIDRHILRMLCHCGVITSDTPPKNDNQYKEIERKMQTYADSINIDMDELDLLFFAHSNGNVLK